MNDVTPFEVSYTEEPEKWHRSNDFRYFMALEWRINTPNPILQRAWYSSKGNVRWEDVPTVIETKPNQPPVKVI